MERQIIAYALLLPIFGGLMIAILIMAIRKRRWWVYIGFGWAVLLLIVFFILGFGPKWFIDFNNPNHPPDLTKPPEFCEGYQLDPHIQQVESVWSDLAFMAAGLFILYLAQGATAGGPNPMVDTTSGYPFMLGMIVIFMGPASMFFHASITDWGGWFDSMSIMLWMIFSLCYSLVRIFRLHWGWFLLGFAVLVIAIGIVDAAASDARVVGYLVFGGLWGVLDLFVVIYGSPALVNRPIKGVRRNGWWYLATLGTFILSMLAFWIFAGGVSSRGCPAAESWFQPHPIFHILSAFVTLFSYKYFASEVRTG
jgi:hypothetical protein